MPKPHREPVRTCVACRQEAGKRSMSRIVRGADGAATIDPTGHSPGRGAYLHHDAACIEIARKRKQLERALHAMVNSEMWLDLPS